MWHNCSSYGHNNRPFNYLFSLTLKYDYVPVQGLEDSQDHSCF